MFLLNTLLTDTNETFILILRYTYETIFKLGGSIMYIPLVEEIKTKRIQSGLNCSQLSIKAGLPQNAIGRIERGDSKFTHPLRAKAIAKALRCRLTDIFEKQ